MVGDLNLVPLFFLILQLPFSYHWPLCTDMFATELGLEPFCNAPLFSSSNDRTNCDKPLVYFCERFPCEHWFQDHYIESPSTARIIVVVNVLSSFSWSGRNFPERINSVNGEVRGWRSPLSWFQLFFYVMIEDLVFAGPSLSFEYLSGFAKRFQSTRSSSSNPSPPPSSSFARCPCC